MIASFVTMTMKVGFNQFKRFFGLSSEFLSASPLRQSLEVERPLRQTAFPAKGSQNRGANNAGCVSPQPPRVDVPKPQFRDAFVGGQIHHRSLGSRPNPHGATRQRP